MNLDDLCLSEALKHSCKHLTLVLSATIDDTHFLSFNISETLPIFFFFEMILIAPETKQEMAQTILYLIGFPSKILDNAAARIL